MLLIIDSNNICWSSFYALSQGLIYRGHRTEIIFGFLKQVIHLCQEFEPTQIVFCWDSKESKREVIYPEYKLRRKMRKQQASEIEKESFQQAYTQFEEIKNKMLSQLGFTNIFSQPGHESDDIIARLVQNREPKETMVVSSDKDLYQLLDYCRLYSIDKKQTTDKRAFLSEYRIEPGFWSVVKAIAGCDTDEVEGIDNVGDKTAIKYLLGELKAKSKAYQKIECGKDIIERNAQLVALPFPGTLKPKIKANELTTAKYKAVCEEYGFKSLLGEPNVRQWGRICERLER